VSKSLKIFLIVLGLGIFVLPSQTLFAQETEQCCDASQNQSECCDTQTSKPCHDSSGKKKSDKNNCGNDCSNCHSCVVSMVFTSLSPENVLEDMTGFVSNEPVYPSKVQFFTSLFYPIWQPPKLA